MSRFSLCLCKMQMFLERAESLYFATLEGKWNEVVAEYQNNSKIHRRSINITNDTALHVAVNDDRADIVTKLVDELRKSPKSLSALEIGNEKGDTPLHCAASRGSLEMCKCIVEAHQGGNIDHKLIEARNKNQETPLYLAALHGHKNAFLFLQSHCDDKSVGPCRRGSDGDTVLHCTIRRDHFELAYEIIGLYGDQIVGSVDEKGISPLHILASKPSAFESSSNFRWYNKILYSCMIVEPFRMREQLSKNNGPFLMNSFNSPKPQTDAENPCEDASENIPPNYQTCNILVRLATCFIWLIFGAFGLVELRKKKVKHVWCGKILEALWRYKNTAYVGGGSTPQGRPIMFATDGDDDQEEEEEEEFPNPFNIGRQRKTGVDSNKEEKPYVDGNKQEDKMKEKKTQIFPIHQSKQNGGEEKKNSGGDRRETALFIAAKNGVLEIVEKIPMDKPGAIHEQNSQGQNVLHVAVEYRQPHAFINIYTGGEEKKNSGGDRRETALFIAAKNGVLEIVEKILRDKPGAIHEQNSQGQNVLHVAVEYRQPHVFGLLQKQRLWENLLRGVDNEGNTVLHVSAKLSQYKPWHIPGSALQMQWEMKWFMYIKDIAPGYVLFLPNNHGETPVDIFREHHESLVKDGTEWLKSTSESCSVVAALIAGVAFATSTTIPGGTQEETGKPNLERHPAFNMFALTSLLALSCSTTSLIMFLSILTSRHQPRDFRKDLPLKLLLGLSSLFVSIASVLVSFSAAFFFVLKDNLKEVVFPLYAATILPISFYAVAQFPLFADLVRAIFTKVPQSSNRESEKLIL